MEIVKNQNFISVDQKTVVNSHGEYFTVGEEVGHDDDSAGTAIILSFEPKLEENEITVHTNMGYAHLDFLVKVLITDDESGQL